MFDSIGWGEIIVAAIAALFIFGPERLPHLAKDAADGLKKVRRALTGVRAQVNDSLGDDFAHLRDIDLRQYHPKTFIRTQLLTDDDEPPARRNGATAAGATAAGATAAGTRGTKFGGASVGSADAMARAKPRDHATPPPFDHDAT